MRTTRGTRRTTRRGEIAEETLTGGGKRSGIRLVFSTLRQGAYISNYRLGAKRSLQRKLLKGETYTGIDNRVERRGEDELPTRSVIKKPGNVPIERHISQKNAPASRLGGGATMGTVVSISGRCVAEGCLNARVVNRCKWRSG